ncbi:uncharacterized protein LOC114349967 isoform X1 [Ostrinia furnacalis]|uniref:uncharacterized protein LOC114349967 isoform X1 n=2 Tax=Ostrinia furnacalis TaxID=93504 RepID=UPI00103B45E7|nr:uncharacterized protein LOC114349967 isoform X1 [Ostrinia furnacalis]
MAELNEDLQNIEKLLRDLERSLKNIKSEIAKSNFEARAHLLKLRHEKIRAMDAVVKSQTILGNMELMVAKTELGLDLKNLVTEASHDAHTSSSRKSKSESSEDSRSKKIKLDTKKDSTGGRKSTSNKENSKRKASKTTEIKNNQLTNTGTNSPTNNVFQQKVSVKNIQPTTPSTNNISLKCSIPLATLTKTINPPNQSVPSGNISSPAPISTESLAFDKRTKFLNHPPIRDTKINKNVGYYSSAHAKEILGYDPDTLHVTQYTDSVSCSHNSLKPSNINAQLGKMQVKHAYSFSVSPGYKLNVSPGYLVHCAQVHRNPEESFGSSNSANKDTNKLFTDILNNGTRQSENDEIRSFASVETLVIKKEIDNTEDSNQY